MLVLKKWTCVSSKYNVIADKTSSVLKKEFDPNPKKNIKHINPPFLSLEFNE